MRFKNNQAGISLIEYIIALILVMIAFISWLSLSAHGIKNGQYALATDTIKALTSAKASELLSQSDQLVKSMSATNKSLGNIAPQPPTVGFYDELNQNGQLLQNQNGQYQVVTANGSPISNANDTIPKFVRQWQIIGDAPNEGEVTIFVSITYKDSNQILRIEKKVKLEGAINIPSN